jgi:hypothetical protein
VSAKVARAVAVSGVTVIGPSVIGESDSREKPAIAAKCDHA